MTIGHDQQAVGKRSQHSYSVVNLMVTLTPFSVGRLIGGEVFAYDPALAQLIPPQHLQHGLQCQKARLP